MIGIVPNFMLPSITDIMRAFILDFNIIMKNCMITLIEAFLGLLISMILSLILALLMDRFTLLNKAFYPLLILSQTIPSVAIAPLLVLWMGYGIGPKVTLIVIVCFFPITVALLDGFRSVDSDTVNLFRSMGATNYQILRYLKLPWSMDNFFSGLKIAVSYSIVGAVIAEWLGGDYGLGVYMTRVKKSYAFDKMFAIIIFISLLSLLSIALVAWLKKICMPFRKHENK